MKPTIVLAHWKIGPPQKQQLHRFDLPPSTNSQLRRAVRALARRQLSAAIHTWRRAHTVQEFEYKITRISYYTADGVLTRKVIVVIKLVGR